MTTIDQIEKEFDTDFLGSRFLEESGYFIKSFYRQKITNLLEELAKEAIGKIDQDEARRGGVDPVIYYNAQGWNSHRRSVIAAFKKFGIKI